MSAGAKLPLDAAMHLAKEIVDDIRPVVERVEVVGSIRRRRPEVSDIELLIEPKMAVADLFGGQAPDTEVVLAAAKAWGLITKGGDRYIQVQTAQNVKVDLNLVHPPSDWWVLYAIRTGPAMLSRWAVMRMHDRGFRCTGAHIESKTTGATLPCASEEDFFRFAGLPYLPPSGRDTPEAMRPLREA